MRSTAEETSGPVRRLAAVLAHPDDESRIMGGTWPWLRIGAGA